MRDRGGVERGEMLRTFNMGIGMTIVIAPGDVERVIAHLDSVGEVGSTIGSIVEGTGKVRYVDS